MSSGRLELGCLYVGLFVRLESKVGLYVSSWASQLGSTRPNQPPVWPLWGWLVTDLSAILWLKKSLVIVAICCWMGEIIKIPCLLLIYFLNLFKIPTSINKSTKSTDMYLLIILKSSLFYYRTRKILRVTLPDQYAQSIW